MTVLVVGSRLGSAERTVRMAIERSAQTAVFVSSKEEALAATLLETPRCVLVDAHAGIRDIHEALRSRAECFGVPVIALTDVTSEQAWLELHGLGADDVVATYDVGGITRRLSALSSFDPAARTALFQGTCLVAHQDSYRRTLLGRVLRQGGFDVAFASNTAEALEVAERSPPKVVVAASRLPPGGGAEALQSLGRQWLGSMPAVLLTESETELIDGPRRFSHIGEDAPPDDLLFVVNELLRPRELVETRASRRLLHAARCGFRVAGEFESSFGLTYNISREGLYVRTFDSPPNKAKVWLELRPQPSLQVCHVRGEVVWTRKLSTGARGAAPPGFGVRLDFEQCPPEDRAGYLAAYDQLCARTP